MKGSLVLLVCGALVATAVAGESNRVIHLRRSNGTIYLTNNLPSVRYDWQSFQPIQMPLLPPAAEPVINHKEAAERVNSQIMNQYRIRWERTSTPQSSPAFNPSVIEELIVK